MASSFSGRNTSTGKGSSGRGPAPAPRAELSTVDFSGADLSRALAECAGMVEVQEAGSGIGAIYEEAAVLYANGGSREAEQLLEAVLAESAANAGEGLWMMLLDLYQLSGKREQFEARVLEYATRFERSPPPWCDLSGKAPRRRVNLAPLINISGNLSAQAAAQFQQIEIIGQKSGAIRIDLKRLRSVDETGCQLLLDTISRLGRERARVTLLNGDQLATMLSGQIHAGRAEVRPVWLLLLEVLQYTGEHERFEDVALDYAVTFEESPPSWDPAKMQATAAGAVAAEEVAESGAGFSLEGEIVSASNDVIRKLAAHAEGRDAVEIDCSQLRRMDFVSAGTLFNILSSLRAQGKLVTLQNVNAMVAALLRVMGVDQVAQVMLRS